MPKEVSLALYLSNNTDEYLNLIIFNWLANIDSFYTELYNTNDARLMIICDFHKINYIFCK